MSPGVAAAAHRRWTLRIVCVSTALLLLNVAAPQVALRAIAEDLDASFSDLQWVLSGYALALAVFLLTAGSLADRFGRRRLFLIGLGLFTGASVLCTAAPSANMLVAARIVQGVGAAVVFPSSLALLAEEFHGADRRRAIGVWGAVVGLSFAAGPLIGGVLVDASGWRAVFACNVLLGLPAIALALRYVRESRDPDPPPPDWGGVAAFSAGLFLVVFAVLRGNTLGWGSAPVAGCLAAGAVALAAFVAVERLKARPMLDLGLFRNRTFTGATAVIFLIAFGTYASITYVTPFLLDVQGRGPVETGLVLSPLAVVSFVVAALAGRQNERVPLRGALVAGMLLAAAGMLLLRAGVRPGASWASLLGGLAVAGAGVGIVNPLVTFAHLGVLPPSQAGLASALNNTARQLGFAIGIAVLGALLEASLRADAGAAARARDAAFAGALDELLLIAAAVNLLGAGAAGHLVRQRDLWHSPVAHGARRGGPQPAPAYMRPEG